MNERIIIALKQRRKQANDSFREKYGYSWDYMLAFKVYGQNEPISEVQAQYRSELLFY
jgi:hypothetical protein